MKRAQRIFLIGFMGSGKSTQGKKLAKVLQRPFIDLDNYIEKKEEMSVENIFAEKSEEVFREKESLYLKQVISRYESSVISCGGGTPCFNDNLELMLKKGVVIYIKMPAEALHNRLENALTPRPMLKDKTPEERLEFIKNLLSQREAFYNRAHITIHGIDLSTEKITEALGEYIEKNS